MEKEQKLGQKSVDFIKYSSFTVLLIVLSYNTYFLSADAVTISIPKTLNPDAEHQVDVQVFLQVPRFDLDNKEIDVRAVWDIQTNIPFQAWVKTSNSAILNFNEFQERENVYEVDQENNSPYISVRPHYFPIMWPNDGYSVDMILAFNDTVSIKYNDPLHASFSQLMADNPEWTIEIKPKLISKDEVLDKIPDWIEKDIQTVANFEVVISRSQDYVFKNLIYAILPAIPIVLITGHIIFVRNHRLQIQAALFTGVVVLLVTTLFAIRQYLPQDVTILETIILASAGAYSGFFFGILYRFRNELDRCDSDRIMR